MLQARTLKTPFCCMQTFFGREQLRTLPQLKHWNVTHSGKEGGGGGGGGGKGGGAVLVKSLLDERTRVCRDVQKSEMLGC